MRLIDADAMLERLESWNTKDEMDRALYNFAWHRIMEQPTAYDVSKVIEELNKEQEVWLRGYEQTLSMGLEHLWRNLSGRAFGVARAIDIVRRGE